MDDNATNIRVAAKILKQNQYNISFAQSGEEALEKVKMIAFDVILLDIMMPGIDGYEVCKRLKQHDETRHIPVIFLTAKAEPENIVKAFRVGGADYVTKPFNGEELLARVNTQVKLKKVLNELNHANKQLKAANDTRDKMFSIISHDLSGPLGNIKESLTVIVNGEVKMTPEAIRDYLFTVWESISASYDLLENLLFWTANQQGKMVLKQKIINVTPVVNETFNLLSGLAGHKSITLETNLEDYVMAYADKNALKTVLRNLVSNAIKFTGRNGKITIDARENQDGFLEITVADTGIGMDAETQNKLFGNFINDTRWGTEGEKGTGLGLVITYEFVKKMGGTIRVKSQPGKGTTFFFTLPTHEPWPEEPNNQITIEH